MRRAYTLIEVLAVAALLGLVAAVTLVSVAGLATAGQSSRVIAELRTLDGRARLLARAEGGATLMHAVDGSAAIVRVRGATEPVLRVVVPEGMQVRLATATGGPAGGQAVALDAAGRSDDYEMVLTMANDTIRWRVHGLTGQLGAATNRAGRMLP